MDLSPDDTFQNYYNEETVKFLFKDSHTEGIYNIESGFLIKNSKNRGMVPAFS